MSVFWYPQHARFLPRSGRTPRDKYMTTGTATTSDLEESNCLDRDVEVVPFEIEKQSVLRSFGPMLVTLVVATTLVFAIFVGRDLPLAMVLTGMLWTPVAFMGVIRFHRWVRTRRFLKVVEEPYTTRRTDEYSKTAQEC